MGKRLCFSIFKMVMWKYEISSVIDQLWLNFFILLRGAPTLTILVCIFNFPTFFHTNKQGYGLLIVLFVIQ
jgi:hypothetical protein